MTALAVLALAAPPLSGCATQAQVPPRAGRPGGAQGQVGLAEFEGVLATNPSATAALEQWCRLRGLADPAQIRATVLDTPAGADEASARAARQALGLGPQDRLGFRHVRLDCGGVILSEAYNWYAPGRLTPEMNQALETTRMPFGKVVAPLGYERELIESRHGAAGGCPPGVVLSHRAMLRLPDGSPLALLVECYTEANLAG